MHPEIIKFWEDFYKEKVSYNIFNFSIKTSNKAYSALILAYKFYQIKAIVAEHKFLHLSHLKDNDIVYTFNEKFYSEDEMLRIIKQKAFL